jgi:hypothetical protein
MISEEQAKRLSRLMDYISKPFFVFMDEQESVLDSDWLDSDEQALERARTLDCPVVNVMRWVAYADKTQDDYGVVP